MTERKHDTPTRKGLRWITIAASLLVLGAGALFLFHAVAADAAANHNKAASEASDKGEKQKAPVPVSVAPIATGSISSYITATGNLVAENEVMVLAEAEGRVAQVRVEEGDTVARGQVLATLAREDAEIVLEKARLKETNARLAHERAQDLVKEELISRESFDKFKMDHQLASQELAEAEWQLEKTTIRAPFAGRVTRRAVQAGQHVRPGDELFQVTDFDPLITRIYLPEKDILGLAEGRAVRLTLNADQEVRFGGRIRQISPVVDTATGTVKVTVAATSPPREVRPGSFVTVDIVRETRAGAVLLPRDAVLRELTKAHVFVASDDLAQKRAVALGLEEGRWVEALSGVAAGERVIVAGQGGLKDGSPIKVLDAAE